MQERRLARARRKRVVGVALGITVAMLPACAERPAVRVSDPLASGFDDPPADARPRTWWHWMNGNVTAEGARRDLEWMKRAGIGGVQLFEGSLGTPRVVEQPLVWMTPEWQAALRSSVETAAKLGLDVQIASSPGWSASGAPFVRPEDAMKKLVWSRTIIAGGRPFNDVLLAPPAVAGPFMDVAGGQAAPVLYRDVALLAYRADEDVLPSANIITGAGRGVDVAALGDGRFGTTIDLPYDETTGEAVLRFDFGRPVRIASFTLGLEAPHGFGAPPAPDAIVEASDDGATFRPVARLAPNPAQARAAAFDPVIVRFMKVRLIGKPGAGGLPPVAEGVVTPTLPPRAPIYHVSEAFFSPRSQVDRWIEKAGFATLPDYYAAPTPRSADAAAIPARDVIDLTARMGPDGRLNWTPPPGRWALLRLGYSLTGKQNGPAPAEATGLEVDKLDADAVGRYVDTYLDRYRQAVGGELIGARGITGILSDSIEAGNQNWTPGMIASFRRLRGYDPIPWLPTLTGIVIGSAGDSDRFLWDYRRTIADLLAEAHYGVIAAKARARGLGYYAEALEDHRPQLGDDLAMRSHADVPMGAMWVPGGERTTLIADVQGAASVANVYGKRHVGAEALTAFGRPFDFAPRDLKATADFAFALGVNRLMIHTSTHQPFEDRRPGLSLSPLLGQNFTRNETWAEMASGWTDYLARSSWLLQQGRHAADIAYFVGEEAPVTALYGDARFNELPQGYGFDFIGADGLAKAIDVADDGRLVSRAGVRYRLLMLGGSSRRMTLATLQRIERLVQRGAVVVGAHPEASPSLGDDPEAWRDAVDRLWTGRGIHATLADALAALNLQPDWSVPAGVARGDLEVLHRTLDDGELWFVVNRRSAPTSHDISFRIAGRAPELWDAVTGERRPLPYRIEGGRTIVPISLLASGSAFILFRQPTREVRLDVPANSQTELASWNEGWQLRLGAAEPRRLEALEDWAKSAEAAERCFSGIGTYEREIDVPQRWLKRGGSLRLELGDVGDVAEVRVNGAPAGIAWTAPFAVDVTAHLRTGRNRIEIRVANLWVNRLIGDAQPGAAGETFASGPTYRADAPLRPSGLLQPVRLVRVDAGAPVRSGRDRARSGPDR